MEARGRCGVVLVLLLAFVGPGAAASFICPVPSVGESVLGRPLDHCSPLDFPAILRRDQIAVVEGDEAAFQRALNLVHKNRGDYVAVLFYASWCPFSKICQPNFQLLSSLFPRVHHFAFEESVIRLSSILSRYGVHGFPTLFLLNSTMKVRYHGSRTMSSLIAFYNDVIGVNPLPVHQMSEEKIVDISKDFDLEETMEQDNCPFLWARSPEKLLQQDTYLALATCFLIMRLLHFLLPKLNSCVQRAWRRQIQYVSMTSLHDYLHAYVEQAKQSFSRLNPRKQSNLQEGAINAKEWASKSLASVSLGEPSSGR